MPTVSKDINIVIVGDEACGKTQLVNSYLYDTFSTQYSPSFFQHLHCDFKVNHPTYEQHTDFTDLAINITDFSGKSAYRQMRQDAYKTADVIILCYSMVDEGKGLSHLKAKWINEELGEYGPQEKDDNLLTN